MPTGSRSPSLMPLNEIWRVYERSDGRRNKSIRQQRNLYLRLVAPDWEVSSSAIYNDGISDFFVIVCQIPLTKPIESWPLCPGCTASVVIKDGMMNMTVRIPAWECPAYVS